MSATQHIFHLREYGSRLLTRLGYAEEHVDNIVATIGALGSGKGDFYLLVGIASYSEVALAACLYAYHAELNPTHGDTLPRNIAAFGEEVAVCLVANDAHLALLRHILLVDKPAI